jgi:uncharacterized protein (TIGR00369 family)
MDPSIPQGFELHSRESPATRGWKPIYSRQIDGAYQLAIRFAEPHSNTRGGLHGGVIATLSDNAMGLTLSISPQGTPHGAVTTSLNIDYISAAKLGQWIVIAPRLVKRNRTMGVIDALVTADDIIIARASANFRIFEAR